MRFKDLIFRLAVTVVPLLVALASCTREEGELWAETECSLQADASIIATRAGGHAVPAAETLSGVEADRVRYLVYQLESGDWISLPEAGGSASMSGGKAGITLRLVKGRRYKLLLWADSCPAGGAPERYVLDASLARVRINESALACNDRSLDAFCAVADVEGGQGSLGVTLTRVLARINIVSDALPSGVEASGLELSDVCTGFDFKTWDVTGERAGLEFPGSACTSLPETVSGKTTLAFAYVFAPAAADFRTGLTLTLTAKGGVEQRSLSGVPLRANHLTNVQYSNR